LITEVGAIREVIGPGMTVEWFIVLVQTTDEPVQTTQETGHFEAGCA
jgi:hypothetical protein